MDQSCSRIGGSAYVQIREAVRKWCIEHSCTDEVMVALSGGADSLALTAAAVAEVSQVHALVVDHQLQSHSEVVAQSAVAQAKTLGCSSARVKKVTVEGQGGMEAAARRSRYQALSLMREERIVLLGHTLDDQAETVLLGLGRGSGPRSMWGMHSYDSPWGRPLLGIRRETTRQACEELGLKPYEDPHNTDPAFTRVRLRQEVLPLLEQVLGGGVAKALARTATFLQEDGEALDGLAEKVFHAARRDILQELDIGALQEVVEPIRRRVVRLWLRSNGITSLVHKHIQSIDDLIGYWHGQGGVAVPGGIPHRRLVVSRKQDTLVLSLGNC